MNEMDKLRAYGVLDTSLKHLLQCPVPYKLQMFGNGSFRSTWEPAVKTPELPDKVVGVSKTNPHDALIRFWIALYDAGVIK